jgi:hypothetical protein
MEMERTMQQILQQLLAYQAEMQTDRKAHPARMEAWGKEVNAKHKGMMTKIDAETEVIRARTQAMLDKGIEANRESNQEELKGMMNATQERLNVNAKEMNSKMDANQAKADDKEEEILARMQENIQVMREVIESGQAEMRPILCTFGSELKETIQR